MTKNKSIELHTNLKGMISMPNKNIDILIKLNLSQENASVNEIIKSVTKTLKSTTAEIIGNIINRIQENILVRN